MPWTREDVAFLRANYKTKTAAEIAAALNKTEGAVHGQKSKLRFTQGRGPGERVSFTVSCLSCEQEYSPLLSHWMRCPSRGWCLSCTAEKERMRYRATSAEVQELVEHYRPTILENMQAAHDCLGLMHGLGQCHFQPLR
ncbi:hypothetical protein [Microvirga sp. P5_D2]|jgi:hypothetical protein